MGEMARVDAYLGKTVAGLTWPDDSGKGLRLNEYEVYGICDLIGIGRCPAHFVGGNADTAQVAKWVEAGVELAAGGQAAAV